jgi:oxalate decarboxylase
MDFNANDVGYVPAVAGHYVENTGTEDLIFLELFKADTFQDISLNNWLRRLPTQMVKAHTNLNTEEIRRIPSEKQEVIGR